MPNDSDLYKAGMAMGRPLDITSQAQKADLQKRSNKWPEGTSTELIQMFDGLLKSKTITQEQYLKVMRDPRQFIGVE